MKIPAWLSIPENETLERMTLAVCVFQLACALWAIVWQANLIAYQRELIRDLFLAVYSK